MNSVLNSLAVFMHVLGPLLDMFVVAFCPRNVVE